MEKLAIHRVLYLYSGGSVYKKSELSDIFKTALQLQLKLTLSLCVQL